MNHLSKILIFNILFINSIIYPMQSSASKTARAIYALQKRAFIDSYRVNFDVVANELKKNTIESDATSNSTSNSFRHFYQTATEYGEIIHGETVKLGDIHQNIIGLPTFTPVQKVTVQNTDKMSTPIKKMTLPQINFELLRSYLHLKELDNDPVDMQDDYERNKIHASFKKNNSTKCIIDNFFTTKQNILKIEQEQIHRTERINKLIAQRFGAQSSEDEKTNATKLNITAKMQQLLEHQNYMHTLLQQQYKFEKIEEEKEQLRALEYEQQVAARKAEIAQQRAIYESKYSTKIQRFIEQTDVYKSAVATINKFIESKLPQSNLPSDYKTQNSLNFFENSVNKRERK